MVKGVSIGTLLGVLMTTFMTQQIMYDLANYIAMIEPSIDIAKAPTDEYWRVSVDPAHPDFQIAVLFMMYHSLRHPNRYFTDPECEVIAQNLSLFPDAIRHTVRRAIASVIGTPSPDAPQAILDARQPIIAALQDSISNVPNETLWQIANSDYGDGAQVHYTALIKLVRENGGLFQKADLEYPAETIRLTSHDPSHVGFATATAILFINALHAIAPTDIVYQWQKHRSA